MKVTKSDGVSPSEKYLAHLCEETFLKAWSYPNPFKADGKELCDLLAVFEDHVYVFFDRHNGQLDNKDGDLSVKWERWKKEAIIKQSVTASGAVRYLQEGKSLFLDAKCTVPFPVRFDPDTAIFHKIIVAHGAEQACREHYPGGSSGSLIISYCGDYKDLLMKPFWAYLDKNNPVHVFDSHTLPIILEELDTIYDFQQYILAKEDAIRRYDNICYCGEEDLLAHYYQNFNEQSGRYYIGTKEEEYTGLYLEEGYWERFIGNKQYLLKKELDQISYLWDMLLQRTLQHALDDELTGNVSIYNESNPIMEMAKEPRFSRRLLGERLDFAIRNYPIKPGFFRYTSFTQSFYPEKGYVFLQVHNTDTNHDSETFRPVRKAMLEVACGVAKNKYPHLQCVIGIAMDAPKFTDINSEDFILLDCREWPDAIRQDYQELNKKWRFFESKNCIMQTGTVEEFPNAE